MQAKPGVCFNDACVLFTNGANNFVQKSPKHNVYLYVDLPFKDPLLEDALERLTNILSNLCLVGQFTYPGAFVVRDLCGGSLLSFSASTLEKNSFDGISARICR